MIFPTILALLFCISAGSINGLEHCQGPSNESQDDFKWKHDAAPIVAYVTATEVKNNNAKLEVKCLLKGQLTVSTLDVPQFSDVANISECHYLTANKNYVVFLDSMKTPGSDKMIFKLSDMEEIEITSTTVNNFLTEECNDEEDNDIDMTMFAYDNNLKCGQFNAVCNKMTKASILNLNYPPLTKTSTFLGGIKKTVAIPKMDDDEGISSKHGSGGMSDSKYRSMGTIATIWMPMIVFITGLTMMFNI